MKNFIAQNVTCPDIQNIEVRLHVCQSNNFLLVIRKYDE